MAKVKYNLDKRDISTLKEYQQHLKNAQAGYMRGIYSIDIAKLEPIYRKVGGKLHSKSCGSCILGMLKKLGDIYGEITSTENRSE